MENFSRYLFLGFGLIGGSLAKAIRRLQPDAVLSAYVRRPERLRAALEDGVLNALSPALTAEVADADLILLCAPTGTNIENLRAITPHLREHTLITDVGSVKQDICRCAEELGIAAQFLGGHPMAGKEKTGYESADAALLKGARYLLTPTAATRPEHTERLLALIRSLGALPLVTDPAAHDRAAAAISHLPHLVAASLVELVRDEDTPDQLMRSIAAGGFKDLTRIASSDPEMWTAISRSNKEYIRELLRLYIERLSALEAALDADDLSRIHELFTDAGAYRASF